MHSTHELQLPAWLQLVAAILAGCGGHSPSSQGGAGTAAMPALPDGGGAGTQSTSEAGPEAALAEEPSVEAGASDAVVESESSDDGQIPDGASSCSPYITNVIKVDYGSGAGFGQNAFPRVVKGPPSGAGCCQGSLSVLSLGEGGSIVVEFGQTILDGPGPDFIVFENAFDIGTDPQKPYAELATVEVSADGVTWFGFPCTASAYPYGMCAGWHPVLANPATNQIDPLDPAVAGGDPFDLADLPGDAGVSEVRYVRITDRADLAGDFDLDAVGVVHGRCR